MEKKKNAFKSVVGKSGGKRPLERPRRRWDNTNMVFKK
jgi:hypothetical protein